MEKRTRNILLILGAAAAAGGAFLYFRRKKAEKEAAEALLIAQEQAPTQPTNNVVNTIQQIEAVTSGSNTSNPYLTEAKKLAAQRGTLGKNKQMLTGDIIELQKLLSITREGGNWTDTTEKVVKQYQLYKGLATDGIVGQATWTALYSDLLKKQNDLVNAAFGNYL